jgi:hypothetical protein
MAKISSPMGRNPRSGGAGQAASYKKGGTTKVAGVMSKGGTAKYQYKGTVTKGKVASTAAKSGASSAKKALESRIASMSASEKAKAAKVAGNAAAERVYKSEGADINPRLFSIQETVRPYMNLPTVKSEMDAAGKKASDRVMNMKKKMGGAASPKSKMTMKKMGKK